MNDLIRISLSTPVVVYRYLRGSLERAPVATHHVTAGAARRHLTTSSGTVRVHVDVAPGHELAGTAVFFRNGRAFVRD